MRAQGWHRDPFELHEDRWFSGGQPTHLVRDHDVESYDEPPPDESPALPVSPYEADLGQLARARLLSSRMAPTATAKATRNWRYWTVWPPCLLTLALSVLFIVLSSNSLAGSPSDTGAGAAPESVSPDLGWILIDGAGLIVADAAAIVVLYAAADRQTDRRACVRAGWIIAVLAYGWTFLIPLLSLLVRPTLSVS